MKKLNFAKWNQKRIETETAIRKLSESIRRGGPREAVRWAQDPATGRWTNMAIIDTFPPGQGTSTDYQVLEQLRALATSLYMLRAELHGRLHQTKIVEYVTNPSAPAQTMKKVTPYTRDMQRERALDLWSEEYLVEVPEPTVEAQVAVAVEA